MGSVIECRQLCFSYIPGVPILDSVNLVAEESTITAIVGQNGAGKSTFYKILAGLLPSKAGSAKVCGLPPVEAARRNYVGYTPQELAPLPALRVYENLFLGREATFPFGEGAFGFNKRKQMECLADQLIQELGGSVKADQYVGDLSLADRQILEIARSLFGDPRVVILDEPTAALGPGETEALFNKLRALRAKGSSILYTSHRMSEIADIADSVAVFRDGKLVLRDSVDRVSEGSLVNAMLGQEAGSLYPEREVRLESGEVTFSVERLRCRNLQGTVTFDVRAGEIVGVAGLVGSGRTTLLRSLGGVEKPISGRVSIDSEEVAPYDLANALKSGILFVPEDRKQEGLVLDLPIVVNMLLGIERGQRRASTHNAIRSKCSGRWTSWFVRDRESLQIGAELSDRVNLRYRSLRDPVRTLSGGNQQKVMLARVMGVAPKVLLLDEPCRGIDIGARKDIYGVLAVLAKQGTAIVMASSDIDELEHLCDRVIVLREFRVEAVVSKQESGRCYRETILREMLGVQNQDEGGSTNTVTQVGGA